MGMVRPSDLGVRAALIADTVPAEQLTGAMGLSRTTSDSARIAGALTGAGLFAAFGIGPAYIVIASFYALSALLTCGVFRHRKPRRAGRPPSPAASSHWRDLREGIPYVWNTPPLLAVMWLALLFNLAAYPLTNGLLPYVAREVYRIDQTGLGYLMPASPPAR